MKSRPIDSLILGSILMLAIILRIIGINRSLWFDEIVTLVEFVRLPTWELVQTFSSLNNHIFYSLQAQLAVKLFGESAWALRFPAMFFGLASIAAIWWLVRENSDVTRAHLTALFLAVSYHHVWFSQNARGYTGLLFWAILGTGFFIKGMTAPSWSTWIAYAGTAALAGYTHLSAGFFFATHGILYLAVVAAAAVSGKSRYPGARTIQPVVGFSLGAAIVVLLHAPILAEVASAMESVAAPVSNVAMSEWKNPLWTVLEVVRNLGALGWLAAIGGPVALLALAAGIVGVSRKQPLLAATFVVNVPFTLFCLWLMSFRIWPRYFFVDVAFAFLFIVEGIFVLSRLACRQFKGVEQWHPRLGTAACLLAAICSAFLLPRNYQFPKQDFLGARNFVEASRVSGDQVASIGLADYPFSKFYAPEWSVVSSWRGVEELRAQSNHAWIVYAFSGAMKEHYPDVVERLESEFELVRRFPGTLGDGDIFVYRSRIPESR